MTVIVNNDSYSTTTQKLQACNSPVCILVILTQGWESLLQ